MLGFLKSIIGGGSQQPRYRFAAADPSFGYGSEVSRIAGLLKQGSYGVVKDFYYSLSSDKRSALVDGIALTEQHAKVLAQWAAKDPGCPVASAFNGAHWTYTAWIARTGKAGNEVTEKQAQAFYAHLDRAFDFLNTSINRGSADPEPYGRMLRVLMGMGEPLDTLYGYYNEMINHDPEHLWGHMNLLMATSAKWLGSDEEMFDFVNETITSSQPGSLLHLLVPMAHIEVWDDKAYDNPGVNHFLENNVRKDVITAYNNSVLSPQFQSSQLRPIVHNYFCFAFHYMGEAAKARTERQAFGDLISLLPWASRGIYELKDVDALLRK